MKNKYTLLIISGLLFCLFSCKKDGNTQSSIIGKWNIVKTTYHNAQNTMVNGIATDYYDFGSNGSLDIHSHPDTYSGIFSLNGTRAVNISIYIVDGHGLGVQTPPAVFTISNLTDHSVTLTSPPYPTGQEIVVLEK